MAMRDAPECGTCFKRHWGVCPERVERMVGLKRVGGSALVPAVGRPRVVSEAVVRAVSVGGSSVIEDDGVSRKAPAGVCPYCDRDRAFFADKAKKARERRKGGGADE